MDEEIYWILKMLSEHRITAQMAKRLLDALDILKGTEGIKQDTAISTAISETHETEDKEALAEDLEAVAEPNIEPEKQDFAIAPEIVPTAEDELVNELDEEIELEPQLEYEQAIINDVQKDDIVSMGSHEIEQPDSELTVIDDKADREYANEESQIEKVDVSEHLPDSTEDELIVTQENHEIEEASPANVIAETPSFILPTTADDKTISRASVNYFNHESASANEFRRLVRNIMHSDAIPDIRSILITSSTKNEGKSLVAANLAMALAKREPSKKILLMDCDLRKPVIHSLFGIEKEPGMVSLILDEVGLNEAIHDTGLGNLKVIPSGRIIDSPSILLPDIKNVIDRCKDWFDVILCDSPPVVPVDDAATMGQYTDGTLFVVMAGKTDRMMVKRALDILNDAKVTVLGIALNNAHGTLPYYYDYKHYGYKPEKNSN